MVNENCQHGEDGKREYTVLEQLMLAQPLSPMRSVGFEKWTGREKGGQLSARQAVQDTLGDV